MHTKPQLCWVAIVVACSGLGLALGAGPQDESKQLDYMLVVTGEELLQGLYGDAHTSFITRTLRPLGGHCVGSLIVDDKIDDIQAALGFATNKAPLVIVTGGLGPTVNDVTRTALAQFTGIKLREHPTVLAALAQRFNTPADELRPNLRRQALVPEQGRYLDNPYGTAVGLVFETGPWVLVALPGPPRELQPMLTNQLVPYLRSRFNVRPLGASITLRFVGLGQSAIDHTLRQKGLVPSDVIETSLFEGSRVDFTFALRGNSPADHARLRQIADRVRAEFGDYVYADDGASLEEVVCRLIRARGGRLVVVEAATAGGLAASLARAPSAGLVLAGAYVGPDEAALRQLIQVPETQWETAATAEQRLQALGQAACRPSRSDWAIVVGPINSTQTPPGLRAAFGFPDGQWHMQRFTMPGSGDTAIANLITQLLDRFRRLLQPAPVGAAGTLR